MSRKVLPLALLAALACEKPGVAPGLDQNTCDGGPCAAPGIIEGSLVYAGPARGDAVLLLFDTQALPPPDGTGTSAAAVARIPAATLFAQHLHDASIGPFSSPFVFTQVPSGRSYQVRAFLDTTGEFDPFFDFTQQPRAGDPAGGHGELVNGQARLVAVPVAAGQVVSGVNVALTQVIPYDPPSFVIAGGSQVFDQSIDQPQRMQLRTTRLDALNASFADAHFGLELDLDAQGNRRSSAGDGLDDVFPRVFLRQLRTLDGTAVDPAAAAIVPCRAIAVPVLPALLQLAPGAPPVARDTLDVFVLPLALKAADLSPLPRIPTGVYQAIVIERSGQVWTLPNQLGDPARAGTPWYAASQAQTVTFDTHLSLPPNAVSGNVVFHGDPSIKSGNIIVQAYLALPYAPPPPVGAALPVRVQIVPASSVTATGDGFTAPYRIDGLAVGGYFIQALADVDGNFSPLNLLQTPTKGDLVGAVIDGTLRPAVVQVSGLVTGQDVQLGQPLALDPPAFEIDDAAGPAQMGADSVAPVRFGVVARPLAFPMAAGSSSAFTVALVRDAAGKTEDTDGDGLPDVWPRAFLVRLDSGDPTDLAQAKNPDNPSQTVTQVIPVAVDPTPFLPALLAAGAPQTLLATRLSLIVRPALLDATDPAKPPVRQPHLVPGKYKIVLINQTGQIWQIPNEAGPAALDPSVVCATASCDPGTVRTQSQGRAFVVTVPSSLNAGSISGTLHVDGAFTGAYVFAYDTANPPPPAGTGTPVSGDFHAAAEFSGGAVSYTLPNLPATRSYVVTAVADTRGDLALSPQLFAAAPGEGTLVGKYAGVVNLAATPQAIGIDLTAGLALPARPSFVLRSGGLDVTDPVTTLFPDALAPQRISLHASAVLTAQVAVQGEADAPKFLVSYQGCDGNGAPLDSDFDNLPDLYPRVLVVRLSDADPTGMTPDPNTTVIPAAVDPTRFSLGACTAHAIVPATDLSVILSPAAVHFVGGQPVAGPIPAGHYGVVLLQSTGQAWRIPNELQPALLDPRAAAAAPGLATQRVTIQVASQVPAATGGSISGALNLNGYSAANVGNVVIAAYDATKPPPPLGLGRPLAVQVIPRAYVAAAAGAALPYALANLSTRTYIVAALIDPLGKLSPLLDFMATPPQGAQLSFFGGAIPSAISVAGAPVTGRDITLAQAQPAIPFERPAFSLQSAAYSISSGSGTAVDVFLAPGTPPGLPYAVADAAHGGGGYFHPTAASGTKVAGIACASAYPSTRVFATPIDTGSPLIAEVVVDPCQFCPSITGTADCSAAPLTPPSGPLPMTGAIKATVNNVALDPVSGAPSGPLPVGHYAVTVVEPTGQTWTVPNTLGPVSAAQGAVFTVTP